MRAAPAETLQSAAVSTFYLHCNVVSAADSTQQKTKHVPELKTRRGRGRAKADNGGVRKRSIRSRRERRTTSSGANRDEQCQQRHPYDTAKSKTRP